MSTISDDVKQLIPALAVSDCSDASRGFACAPLLSSASAVFEKRIGPFVPHDVLSQVSRL